MANFSFLDHFGHRFNQSWKFPEDFRLQNGWSKIKKIITQKWFFWFDKVNLNFKTQLFYFISNSRTILPTRMEGRKYFLLEVISKICINLSVRLSFSLTVCLSCLSDCLSVSLFHMCYSIEPISWFRGSGLGLLLTPYVRWSDGLIWAT